MTVYLATNEAGDFGGDATNSTDAGFFDSTYVSSAIRIPDNTRTAVTNFPTPVGNDLWVHYETRHTAKGGAQDGTYFGLNVATQGDWNNGRVIQIDTSNGNDRLFVFNSGLSQINSAFASPSISGSVLRTFDIHLQISGADLIVTWYGDGIQLVPSVTRTAYGHASLPNRMFLASQDSSNIYWSQILVQDTTTLNRKVAQLRPASQGNENQWTGDFSQLNDSNVGTVATTPTVAQRQASVAAAYTGPTTGGIENVILNASAAKNGASGPQNLDQYLRISSTNYDNGNPKLLSDERILPTVHEWTTNPATTNPWAFSDLTGIEMGLLSAT